MRQDEEFVADEDEEQDLDQALGELEQGKSIDVDEEGPEEEPLAETRYREVVTAIRDLLAGQEVDLGALGVLADRERDALEYLQGVVTGRTASGEFMYAEDRLTGLNQVLAELQPILSVATLIGEETLRESLDEVVDGFSDLRDRLTALEDAQEEVFHAPEEETEGEGDEDDEGEGDEAGAGGAASGGEAAAVEEAAAIGEAAAGAGDQPTASERAAELMRDVRKRRPPPKPSRPEGKPAPAPAPDADADAERPPARSTVWDPDDSGGASA